MLDEEIVNKKIAQIEEAREEDAAKAIAQSSKSKYLDLRFFPVDPKALFLVDEATARAAGLAIISKNNMELAVAVQNPQEEATRTAIAALTHKGFTITLIVASAHSLAAAWERYRTKQKGDDKAQGIMAINEETIANFQKNINDIKSLKEQVVTLPITQVLDALLAGALNIGASDIHLEPEEKEIRLRYRLDGVLTDVVSFSPMGYPSLLSRIKLTSGLKINVHETPQDGRFTIRLHEKDIEIRVSILPGAYGENIVMRILDPSSIRQKLEDLGMREDTLALAKKLLEKTTGAILTTGPTGAGKTTTLYAFIQHLNTADVKIITIEDPIEYHIKGISQTQVNESADYTFAAGLRSIVRQDPDIILVGEIRDKETAEIGMQAALTGHLVLSTLHANNAASTVLRLIDLGLKPVSIAPALHAIMAQRLVRRLCEACKKQEVIHPGHYKTMQPYIAKLPAAIAISEFGEQTQLWYPAGCAACNNTGYKGRVGVYEIFAIDDKMQKLILSGPSVAEIEGLAVENGLTTLLQDAFIKVVRGVTSFDEVMRVIGE